MGVGGETSSLVSIWVYKDNIWSRLDIYRVLYYLHVSYRKECCSAKEKWAMTFASCLSDGRPTNLYPRGEAYIVTLCNNYLHRP